MKNGRVILEQSKKYDSFYLYDESRILKNTTRLKRDFNTFEFFYSLKTNPAPAVAACVLAQGFGADAASLAEVRLAHSLGVSADRIQYSAPGKSTADLSGALGISTLIADSMGEVLRIQEIAESKGTVAEIGVRINPDFTFSGSGGVPSKFGVDEEQALATASEWNQLPNVRIVGIHVHSRSQELDAKVLERYYQRMFQLTGVFQETFGHALKFVNMGSGFGIPYSNQDQPLDTAYLGGRVAELTKQFREKLPGVRIIVETGRYAVCESGCYVTKVMDRKESMGTTFVVLANTLNGFIRPCIAQLVANYSNDDVPAASEPLYTGKDSFRISALTDETETETVTLVGNLCTATDIVAKNITMPKLKRGDVVVFSNAGSYAAVLSPIQFSSQKAPAQLFLSRDGTVSDAAANPNS